jgi:hypothetical protein
VKVFGLAYSANKVDRPFEGQSKADIESQRPTFTFTAYVESDDGLYRRELQPKNDPVRRDAQGNLEARAVLELPVPDEAPYRGGKIFVMTEETELRPKATLPDEPVHIGVALANPAAETAKPREGERVRKFADEEYTKSGERFICRTELPVSWGEAAEGK